MVGNGATNWDFDVSPSFPQTVYNFNIIPKSMYDTFVDNKCFYSFNDVALPEHNSALCNTTWAAI